MKKFSILALIAVFIIGIGIFASDILLQWLPFIGHTPEYGAKASAFFMAITALMTLLLASATFNSTKQSKLGEQERRKDNIEKENRDRKERYLNEIIEWLNDVNSRIYDIGILTGDTYEEERNTVWILTSLSNSGKYIHKIAECIFGNPLKDSIKATGNAVNIYLETLVYSEVRTFKILGMPDKERDRLVRELDEAIAEDHRNSSVAITNNAMVDAIKSRCAGSLRDKAIKTLAICAELKADLLNE